MSDAGRNSVVVSAVAVTTAMAIALAGSHHGESIGGVSIMILVAAIAFAINWVVFVPSYVARTEQYFDLTGSITYFAVVWLAVVLVGRFDARAVLVAVMVSIWAGRLGSFLFVRVRRAGKDGRFDSLKQNVWRFFLTWTIQGLWVVLTLCSALAIITTDSPRSMSIVGYLGVAMWVAGLAIEILADQQKKLFREDASNDGRFITTGLWSWSRHPNYFGEIMLWVGIAVLAIPILRGWQWLMLISPVFVFVLLTRISGIPLLAARGEKRWGDDPEYRTYLQRTSKLIPRPPRSR